ncbi:MAG TPA: hypothetical protein VHP58_03455, partial [Alphaproteobacteria bacterium]|nr:hypothetical protein [Alphaproteobacteria bacterium]
MAKVRPFKAIALWGWLFAVLMLAAAPAFAQEQFFTQSGGRGIENAKANARITKVEKDVDSLNVEMAKVKPHAKMDIPSCADAGSKLRWNNNAWSCDNETDPTVKSWAKGDLPNCGAHQMLSASAGGFTCNNADYVSNEVDPTVQTWAKSPLPSCGAAETLTSTGGAFTCKVDDKGLMNETDPFVFDFARNDRATITDCNAGQKLTMNGGRLVCAIDAIGVTSETDPFVQAFARSDISSSVLSACGAGKVLTAETSGPNVILSCVNDAGGAGSALALDDLSDVATAGQTSGTVLIYNGTEWVPGSARDSSVKDYARVAITACNTGQVVVYDGTALKCVGANTIISSTTKLAELDDVNFTTSPTTYDILHFNGTSWVNSRKLDGVTIGSSLAASATFTQVIASGIGAGNIQASGLITAPVMTTSASLVQGDSAITGDLRVGGTLYVSGGQSIEGVLFANGGVSATGSISASRFSGDGSGLTNVAASSVDWYNVGRVPAVLQNISNSVGSVTVTTLNASTARVSNATIDLDLRVGGNLYVSGAQTIEGVTFANGGVSATGAVTATSFSGDGSHITGVLASAVDWYNVLRVPAVLQNISNSVGSVTVTTVNADNISATSNLDVGGNQRVAGGLTAGNIGTGNILASGAISSAAVGTSNMLVQGNGTVTGDFRVGGNFYVSGAQTIDGVTFAKGGVSATGIITATSFSGDGSNITGVVASAVDWYNVLRVPAVLQNISNSVGSVTVTTINAGNISATNNLDVDGNQRVTGGLTAGSIGTGNIRASGTISSAAMATSNGLVQGDLRVTGNLYVSGAQTIEGVTFANGGVSATGIVTATSFSGDGSNITGMNGNNITIPDGISGSLVYRTAAGKLYASTTLVAGDLGLGIGTGSPQSLLDVNNLLNVRGDGGQGTYVVVGPYASTLGGDRAAQFNITNANDGGIALFRFGQVGSATGATGEFGAGENDAGAPWANKVFFNTKGSFPLVWQINGTESMRIATNTNVGIHTTNPTTDLEVAGTISASNLYVTGTTPGMGTVSGTYGYFSYISGSSIYGNFVGDGSGLTGVTAGSSDRIVSGTTAVYANANTGYVSFTSAGNTTGWYSPGGIFAAVGISTTSNQASFTTIFANGLATLTNGISL